MHPVRHTAAKNTENIVRTTTCPANNKTEKVIALRSQTFTEMNKIFTEAVMAYEVNVLARDPIINPIVRIIKPT